MKRVAGVCFRLAGVLTPDEHVRYVVVDAEGSVVAPITGYLRYLDDTGKARNTLRVYGLGLAHYFAYLSERDLDYLTAGMRARAGFVAWLKRPRQVRQLQPGRSVSQARSNTTINLYLTAVSGLYDYLFRTEQISKNPNDQLAGPHRNRPYKGFLHHAAPKLVTTNILAQAVARRKRPTTISKEQVEQLRAACECRRDRALVRLMNDVLAYVSEAHTKAVETNHVFLVSHGSRRGQPLR